MKKSLTLAIILALGACGKEQVILESNPGDDGASCQVQGSLLVCGSTTFDLDELQGADGAQGATGPQGKQGDKGDTGAAGQDGADGKDG